LANMESKLLKSEFVDNNGLSILIKRIDQNADHLRLLIESLKKDHPESLIFFASSDQSKALFVAYCGPTVIKAGFKAGDLVKEAAVLTLGNGGGRPDFAQAGGKDVSKLNDAIEIIRKKIM